MIARAMRAWGGGRDHRNAHPEDWTPTPAEATAALLDREEFVGTIHEPACGDGVLSDVLRSYGYRVIESDLVDRGRGGGKDFLAQLEPRAPNIITNPPFKLAPKFCRRATELSTGKVAMLLTMQTLATDWMARLIADGAHPARLWIFAYRLPFKRGGYTGPESAPFATTCWVVWDRAHREPTAATGWITR